VKSFLEYQYEKTCWDGYKQVGMKKKGKKMVPNCVPEETLDEKRIDIKKAISKIKGLTSKQAQVLQTLLLPVLNTMISQLQTLVMGEDLDEATLAASNSAIVASLLKLISRKLNDDLQKGKLHDVNVVASLIKKKVETDFKRKGHARLKNEENELEEKKSETWEAGYKRRVVKTTKPEHKEKGYNWRIKGKEKAHLTIKLYKDKPSQEEFNKQMKRVAGHEFGG